MSKVAMTVSGAMGGAVFTLLLVLVTQNQAPVYAQDSQGDAGMGRVIVNAGGTQGNINDLIFVLYQRPDPAIQGSLPPNMTEGNRTTLAVYRVQPGRQEMTLENVRDISLDLLIPEYIREGRSPLSLSDIRRELQRGGDNDRDR